MIETVPRPDANLAELLAARARHASDGQLAFSVAIGLLAGLAFAYWRPPAWHIFLAVAICILAFGGWGITDRELSEASAISSWHPVLRGARLAAALSGFASAVFALLAVMAGALGTWIS